MRRFIAMLLCFALLLPGFAINARADGEVTIPTPPETDQGIEESSAITVANLRGVQELIAQRKFSLAQGKGFAAEYGNNLVDRIKGTNARVIGDSNEKNGADRIILGRDGSNVLIQTKYYNSAKATFASGFDSNGVYKYLDKNGYPMQFEVPKDQYDDIVVLMREKIANGKVPGVTDPEEATNIVRKGNLTFKQAENLAKAGTFESLKYDSVNGIVVGLYAFGLDTAINYILYRLGGEDRKDAIAQASKGGLQAGGIMFGAYVLASQFTKTGIAKDLFKPTAEILTQKLGPQFAERFLSVFGKQVVVEGGETVAEAAKTQVANTMRFQAFLAVAIVVVSEIPDFVNLFRGRISKTQFVKNLAVAVATAGAATAGGVLGGMLGSLIPGPGTAIGAVVGGGAFGFAGHWAADWLADYIAPDDSDKMYNIVQDEFAELCDEYLVNEDEAKVIADKIGQMLDSDTLMDMYQSKDREEFIRNRIEPVFAEKATERDFVEMPTEEEMRLSLLDTMEGLIFIH